MTKFTEKAVRQAIGLSGGSDQAYSTVSTDTRAMSAGALFVALKGDRFDGHDYLAAARDAGAAAAIVRRGTAAVTGLVLFEVPDTLRAYGLLARMRRRDLHGPVLAITGTNGKTSTKEMLAAVLRTRYRTYATRENLNNLVGVPQTILEAPADAEALVVEAGANLPGEVARYREIIEPSLAIVTNAVAGHLEGFGSLEAVMAEKLALTAAVPTVLVGLKPPGLAEGAAARGAGRVLTVGLEGAQVRPERVTLDGAGRPIIEVDGHTIHLPLLGRHQAENAMFAWAVVRLLGLDAEAAARALEQVTIPKGRGQVIQSGGLTIINDCYNANPQSFRAIIEVARQARAGRRLVFVAGTMLELGADHDRLHLEVARELVALAPELLAVVGDFVRVLGPWKDSLGDRLLTAPDAPAMGPLLAARLRGDELVVLKASRGMALERIIPAIAGRSAPSTEA